jgi:hypothetical protein
METPYKVNRFSIHFEGRPGSFYQLVLNIEQDYLKIYKKAPNENRWDEIKNNLFQETKGKIKEILSSDNHVIAAEKAVNIVMAFITMDS